MEDNGLLKYYASYRGKNGFLDVSKLGILKNTDRVSQTVVPCAFNDERFYVKFRSFETFDKELVDAEILCSQIYKKMGVESAIYLPAEDDGKKFVISNSVLKPNVMPAQMYLFRKLGYNPNISLPFLSAPYLSGDTVKYHYETVEKYLTRNAMQEQTKMRILDTACFNTDRHRANFLYTVNSIKQTDTSKDDDYEELGMFARIINYFKSMPRNKADSITAIDFESSGYNFQLINEGEKSVQDLNFHNDFQITMMNYGDLMEEYKYNDSFASLVDKKEIAEEMGALDIGEVAQDIKDTIGYEVSPNYVQALSRSFDDVAETLLM